MRISRRELALLALPMLSNAVSLADMTPRATGLPQACNAVYTSQIYGCTPTDFQTNQCTSSCINALYGVAEAISHACSGQGITGQNLVVAFLAGVGPQQLCHNANGMGHPTGPPMSPTQSPQQTHWSPTIVSSTTTAPKATNSGSLLVDTSSVMTQTIIPHKTKTTQSSQPASTTSKTTPAATHTTQTSLSDSSTKTTTAAAAHSSQAQSDTNFNDHSGGGGTPFDTPGNMSSASDVSISMVSMVISAAFAMLAALR